MRLWGKRLDQDSLEKQLERQLERHHRYLIDRIAEMRVELASRTVSVLLIAEAIDGSDWFSAWSGELKPGEVRQAHIAPQLPIRPHWLIGLNGALLEQVRVGDRLQDVGVPAPCPVARLHDGVQPGIYVFFSVRL